MPYYRTVEQIAHSYETRRYGNNSFVINGIRAAKKSGLYTPDFESQLLNVANSVSYSRLKWFFGNAEYHFHDRKFDFAKYAQLFLEVHDTLGPTAARWFASTYSHALEKGVDPERLLYAMTEAAEVGGKTFAARIVSDMPGVLAQGAQARPYVDACARVYELGEIPLLYPFTLNLAGVMKLGMNPAEFANVVEKAAELGGPIAAKNMAENTSSIITAGHDPWEILSDAARISRSRNAAGYYISAFTRLAISSHEVHKELEGSLNLDPRVRWIPGIPTVGEKIKHLRAKGEAINPEVFRENYESLLGICQGAAVFYATAALTQKHEARNFIFPVTDDYKYFSAMPQRVRGFHSSVPARTFHRSMWFVTKMRQPYREKTARYMSCMLDDIETSVADNGQEATDVAIGYTSAASRKGRVESLIIPRTFFGGGEFEIDYEPTCEDEKFLDMWRKETL